MAMMPPVGIVRYQYDIITHAEMQPPNGFRRAREDESWVASERRLFDVVRTLHGLTSFDARWLTELASEELKARINIPDSPDEISDVQVTDRIRLARLFGRYLVRSGGTNTVTHGAPYHLVLPPVGQGIHD